MAQRIVGGEQYEAFLLGGDTEGSSVTVDGRAYRSVVSFARPGDATAYTAGDVIGTSDSAIHTLSGVGPSGGTILIQAVSMFIGNTSVPVGMGAFRLHLYRASPSGVADNAAFNLTSGEASAYMGYADLPAPQDLGSMLYSQAEYIGRPLQLASGQTNVFAEIETRGAYTPASGTTYEVRLNALELGL